MMQPSRKRWCSLLLNLEPSDLEASTFFLVLALYHTLLYSRPWRCLLFLICPLSLLLSTCLSSLIFSFSPPPSLFRFPVNFQISVSPWPLLDPNLKVSWRLLGLSGWTRWRRCSVTHQCVPLIPFMDVYIFVIEKHDERWINKFTPLPIKHP